MTAPGVRPVSAVVPGSRYAKAQKSPWSELAIDLWIGFGFRLEDRRASSFFRPEGASERVVFPLRACAAREATIVARG